MITMVDYKKIGIRIRKQRIEKGLTQEQLAEQAEVSLSFIGHIERGTRKASVEMLARLSKALEMDMHYIVFGYSSGYRNFTLTAYGVCGYDASADPLMYLNCPLLEASLEGLGIDSSPDPRKCRFQRYRNPSCSMPGGCKKWMNHKNEAIPPLTVCPNRNILFQ